MNLRGLKFALPASVLLWLLIIVCIRSCEAADNIYYRDAFIKTTVIAGEDGLLKLDLPFTIYHQTVVNEGKNYYCYLSKNLENKEVIAFIHYAIADEDKVKAFSGYLDNDWKKVRENTDALKHWYLKKEDALAKIIYNDELGTETVIKYDEKDKLDIVHPYLADDKKNIK